MKPWPMSAVDRIRERLDLVTRVFGPVDHREPPILPRDISGGFAESAVPACRRNQLGCMPNEAECWYCGDIAEEGA